MFVKNATRSVAIAAAVVFAVGMAFVPAGSAVASDIPTPGTWRILDATVVDSSGSEIPNARVAAYALPVDETSTSLPSVLVGEGTTDGSGDITLDGQLPSSADRYVRPDGTVKVEVDVLGAASFAQLRLQVPSTSGSPATSTSGRSSVASSKRSETTSSGAAGARSEKLTLRTLALPSRMRQTLPSRRSGLPEHAGVAAVDPDDPTTSQSTDSTGTTSGFGCQDGYSPTYIRQTSTYVDHPNRIQQLHTGSNAHIHYSWNTSNDTQLATVFNASGDIKGVPYQESLDNSVEETNSAGVDVTAISHTNEFVALTWRWYQYKKYCSGNFSFNQGLHYTGSWEWRPYKWTGGSSAIAATSTFVCHAGSTQSVAFSTWVAKTTARTISGAATVAGVSVSAKQTNSSSQKLTVAPISGRTAKVCGTSSSILTSAEIREVD